ncbi:MAG: hypothetical protein M1132_12025 [Chloroflexi bacterium]|nr:hypothetical protein [Chloroflexota bacterium]
MRQPIKTNDKHLLMRRIVPAAMSPFAVVAFANALQGAYRSYQICPPGLSQQSALALVAASGFGLVLSLILTLLFATLTILELARRKKLGREES